MTITERNIKNIRHKADIKNLYLTSFPKEERLPWRILRLMDILRCDLTAYYDGETFCGMAVTATTEDILYVMFFAVEGSIRGKGYGSGILQYLRESNPDKTILLNVEIPDEAASNNDQRIRRMAFYEKNGFRDTGYNIREVGGVFRILSSTGKMETAAYQRVFRKLSYGLWKPTITKVR